MTPTGSRAGRVAWLALGALLTAGFQVPSAPNTVHTPTAPTFYKDVLPIIQAHCQECHKPQAPNLVGLVAPMSLMTYDDVHAAARAIVRAVRTRDMPPWFATPRTHGVFANERSLTDLQIATITAWQNAGMPAGRVGDAPPPRDFGTRDAVGWTLGEPNIAVAGEPHLLDDATTEDMVTFEVGELPQDVWVQGVEFRAGSTAVHHMCGAAILPPSISLRPGIDRETSLGCAAPGTEPRELPDGYAFLLPKGAAIRLDMHYFKKAGPGTAVTDISQVGLTFSRTTPRYRARFNPAGNTTFEVPPGQADWRVGSARVFEAATTILALWPHGHSRTASATYWAFYPDGRKELLLEVPRYDHRWQQLYVYRTPKIIPPGTRIEVIYKYDNSPARAAQKGFDATQPVRFGARADDEMMLGFINYAERVEASGVAEAGTVNETGETRGAAGSHLGHGDAADLDRLTRGSTTLPGRDGVRVDYAKLAVATSDFAALNRLRAGHVFEYVGSSAMRLRTEVGLRFGDVTIPAGNWSRAYAGLYGLWLKKVSTGWGLAFTRQPDVWGTQYEATAVVAEAPLRYERVSDSVDAFTASFEGDGKAARLVLRWGQHQWTVDVTVP